MTVLRTGLIGDHIGKSRFADALRLLCARHDLAFEFHAIDSATVAGFDLAHTVATCRAAGWSGVAITHPWKQVAARLGDDLQGKDAARLGACNTLVFAPTPSALNTDYLGFLAAWEAVFATRPPGRVALAGAGGVACAIAPALVRLGAEDVAIWDHAPGAAETLANTLGPVARVVSPAGITGAIAAADGLVNATPLGMDHHPGSAFDAALIGPQAWAFDAVYTPVHTPFLRAATAQGLAILTGFDLFRFMALHSFAALSGLTPDPVTTLADLSPLIPVEEPA